MSSSICSALSLTRKFWRPPRLIAKNGPDIYRKVYNLSGRRQQTAQPLRINNFARGDGSVRASWLSSFSGKGRNFALIAIKAKLSDGCASPKAVQRCASDPQRSVNSSRADVKRAPGRKWVSLYFPRPSPYPSSVTNERSKRDRSVITAADGIEPPLC